MQDTIITKFAKIFAILGANLLIKIFLIPFIQGFISFIGLIFLAGFQLASLGNIGWVFGLILAVVLFFGIPSLLLIGNGLITYKWIKDSENARKLYATIVVLAVTILWLFSAMKLGAP